MNYDWVKPYEKYLKRRVNKTIWIQKPVDAEKYERHRQKMLKAINDLFDREENENYGNHYRKDSESTE